jgi:hypothetical protein
MNISFEQDDEFIIKDYKPILENIAEEEMVVSPMFKVI